MHCCRRIASRKDKDKGQGPIKQTCPLPTLISPSRLAGPIAEEFTVSEDEVVQDVLRRYR